jgi:hypothetical protein
MIGPIEILLWMLAAVVKFVLTPSLMIGLGIGYGVTVATCSIGASLGVYVFFHFGKLIFAQWRGNQGKRGKKKRVFTSGRRRWVRFQTRFGLWGLLIISGLISVPISAILAAKYHQKDERMPWLLMGAFVVWTVVLTSISAGFGANLTE